MDFDTNYFDFVPTIVPQKMSGTKLTCKIELKSDYVRADGTCALYLVLYLKKRKRIPLNLAVMPKYFDKKKQRVKKTFNKAKDYNLLIEKMLADINTIELNYRLSDTPLTLDALVQDLFNPSLRINFNTFANKMLKYQHTKKIIATSTYKQQLSALKKIKSYKDPILFTEITTDFVSEFRAYMRTSLKNAPQTVESTIKNFKKYVHIANNRGINTPLRYNAILVQDPKGQFTFLLPEEVKKLYTFYNSAFINTAWKNILQRYLFGCFTGLRISDIERIEPQNFINGTLAFTTHKTKKFQSLTLNDTAKQLIEPHLVFYGQYSREHINRELKKIAKLVGIKKRVYFHSSRHTFATNYLIAGGQIQNLKKALGHSKIETTMKYAHVVNDLMNEDIKNLDSIVG